MKRKSRADYTVGMRSFCRLVGRKSETVKNHARLFGLECFGPKVDLALHAESAHKWFVENAALLKRMRASADDEPRAEAERRKAIAAADREELKAAREKRLVIDRAEAEKHGLDLVRYFAAACERAAVDLAVLLAGVEKHQIRTTVDDYFYRLRTDMSEGKPIQLLEKKT